MTTSPTIQELRSTLGAELRFARKQSGLAGTELAMQCKFSQSKISRMENGRVAADPDDIARLVDHLRIPPEKRDQLVALARDIQVAEFKSWRGGFDGDGLSAAQSDIRQRERGATKIDTFQPSLVPGLLQTLDYAQSILSMVDVGQSREEIRQALLLRIDRQEILHNPDKQLRFIVTESALRNLLVQPEHMRMQIDRLTSLAREAFVSIGVLPSRMRSPLLPLHPFVIHDNELVTIELLHGELVVHRPEEVQIYATAFEAFWATASQSDPVEELERVRNDVK